MKTRKTGLALTISALVIVGSALSGNALAATETGTLTVTATVGGICSVGDQTLAFGTVTVGAGNVDASAIVDAICTTGITGLVTFNDGLNKVATLRRMKHSVSADYIDYALYSNSYTTQIPADNGTTTAYTIVGSGVNQPFTVYGRIPTGTVTAQPTGSYTDSVTMTITYTP